MSRVIDEAIEDSGEQGASVLRFCLGGGAGNCEPETFRHR